MIGLICNIGNVSHRHRMTQNCAQLQNPDKKTASPPHPANYARRTDKGDIVQCYLTILAARIMHKMCRINPVI